jgi:hypothetical protein
VATATRSPRSRHLSTSGNISRIEFLPSLDKQFFPKAQALIPLAPALAIGFPIIIHHAVMSPPDVPLLRFHQLSGDEWERLETSDDTKTQQVPHVSALQFFVKGFIIYEIARR